MKQKEIWQPVVGYENWYAVSNFGGVKSLNRTITNINGKVLKIKGVVLRQSVNNVGYRFVSLCIYGKSRSWLVHRLVALSFLKKDKHRDMVNHKDGNPFGAIIGKVELVDVYSFPLFRNDKNEHIGKHFPDGVSVKEESFGDYSPGRFGWLLSDPVLFDEPISAKGQQGLWNFDI